MMANNLSKEELKNGVVCASTGGDYTQAALSLAANKIGITEIAIVMPSTTPSIKVQTLFFVLAKTLHYLLEREMVWITQKCGE